MEATDRMKADRKEIRAADTAEADTKRRRSTRQFAQQVIIWAVTCAFLAVVNRLTSPHYWWVLWVIAGWGLNIALSLAWYLFDCDDECNYRNR